MTRKDVMNRLTKEGVNVPTNFCEMALENMVNGRVALTEKDIEGAFQIANFWKQYAMKDPQKEYGKLMMKIIMSLYRIHCVAISTHTDTRSYIGNTVSVDRNREIFRDSVTTVLSLRGNASFVGTSSKYKFI